MSDPQPKEFYRNLMVRSNKPGTFQSVMMSAIEFGGTGCSKLEVISDERRITIHAIRDKDGRAIKTARYNWQDVAEFYGDRYHDLSTG